MTGYRIPVFTGMTKFLSLLVKYPSDSEVRSEKVDEDNPRESYGERDIENGMHGNREDESEKNRFYITKYSRYGLVRQKGSREIESHDDATDDMGHKGKNGSKHPSHKGFRAPNPRLFRYIFEIEDIFHKSETESDEDGKKHSFFHGIDGRKGAREDTEMFARLFYESDDDIVEKHELECSENDSRSGDSSACEGSVHKRESEKKEMEKSEKSTQYEKNERISQKSSPNSPHMKRKKPDGKNENTPSDDAYGDEKRNEEINRIIAVYEQWKYVPASEIGKCHDVAHKEYRHY